MPESTPLGVHQDPTLDHQSTITNDSSTPPTAQPSNHQKSTNKLFPVVIILAIISLTSISANIFSFIQNSTKSTEINNLKSQLIANNIEPNTSQGDSAQTSITNPAANNDQILAKIPSSLSFANSKCLNDDSHSIQAYSYSFINGTNNPESISKNYDSSPYYATFNATTNTVTLNINYDAINSHSINPNLTNILSKTGAKSYNELNFSGKVIDILMAGYFGNADFLSYATLFALLEDGSIEYIPIKKALQDNNLHSYGKLAGISNVIKFYYSNEYAIGFPYGGGINALAQRADGDYYNLYQSIIATNNY